MNGPKRIYIAAYYFPPLGLAGVFRPLAMANFFAGSGLDVHVITVKDVAYPIHDRDLLEQIDSRVNVIRVGSRDPERLLRVFGLSRLRGRLKSLLRPGVSGFMFPDSKTGFVLPAYSVLKQLAAAAPNGLLVTTSPPVSIHRIGLMARKQLPLKWVADWRDIWGPLPFAALPARLHERARDYTRSVVSSADLVTATSPKSIEYFEEVDPTGRYNFLPNGYHEVDFRPPPEEVQMSVGIYGSINRLVGLPLLLEWLSRFRREHPELHWVMRHTGHTDLPDLDQLLAKAGLTDQFHSDGYLPHFDAVQRIRSNKINLLSLSAEEDTSYIVPSRLFELLRAEPPLIAVLPRGNAARQLLEEHNLENVSVVDGYDAFAIALQGYLTAPVADSVGGRQEAVGVFERQWQLADLHERLAEL